MEKETAPICAAIDVGSNTIHIVVARCFPTTLQILADELDLTRIGESVTASGAISPEKTRRTLQTLHAYQALAAHYEAEQILVVATEAIRQASNRSEFLAHIRAETGLQVHLISGAVEAMLTFAGATYEAGPQEQLGVLDLGGGSLELAFARQMQMTWRTSLPLGSGWLHDQYLPGNPPTSDDILTAETFLRTYMQKTRIGETTSTLIVTGGSANSLLHLARRAFSHPQESQRLSLENLLRCQSLLTALSAEEIARQYDQPLARARILLAGTLILKHTMHHLALQEISVSPHGIREGVLLAYARSGEHWLTDIEEESRADPDAFAHAARTVLLDRLQALLTWPKEVRKHEDIEAVHKMRVASRRLRAALDAYQSCCAPKRFATIYRRIRQMSRLLGKARDTDVLIHYLRAQQAMVSESEQVGLGWLIACLHAYRQRTQEQLDLFLRKLDPLKLEQQLKHCIRETPATEVGRARPQSERASQAAGKKIARQVLRDLLAEMDAYAPYIQSPEHIQELHSLRIAIKHVRYTLEVFTETLPAHSQEFVAELAQLQDELGVLHDSEVMLALLRRLQEQAQASLEYTLSASEKNLLSPALTKHILLAARHSPLSAQEIEGLQTFHHRQEQRRAEAYGTFRRHWEALEQRLFRTALARMFEARGLDEQVGRPS